MKANQAFRNAEEAVSPVIGVILMVAITVVLAAVVLVLVNNLSKNSSDTAPNISASEDEVVDQVQVNSADPDADWNRLAIHTTQTTVVRFALNGNANTGSGAVSTDSNAATPVTTTSNPIGAGEYLDFCGASAILTPTTITVIDTAVNQKIGDYTFSSIALCLAP
ncbi:MAG TPA: type IV pilin [Candidatus Thermoplasmatota archaeon]|nr:type IV pilin [Candidatus Thermoplasmatota archaeon]